MECGEVRGGSWIEWRSWEFATRIQPLRSADGGYASGKRRVTCVHSLHLTVTIKLPEAWETTTAHCPLGKKWLIGNGRGSDNGEMAVE